jgi:hypothetical protein
VWGGGASIDEEQDMADQAKSSSLMPALQGVQLIVTVILAIAGFGLTRDTEQFRQSIATIEGNIKQRQEERAEQESREKLRFQVFGHVAAAIEKGDPKQQQAATALVTSLLKADDPLRLGLIGALRAGAEPSRRPAIEKVALEEARFATDEAAIASTVTRLRNDTKATGAKPALGTYLIDVFYCAGTTQTAREQHARKVEQRLRTEGKTIRLRLLTTELNASPGYGVVGLQVRHDDDERADAMALIELLRAADLGAFEPKQVRTPTPGYLSVFVCSP